MTLQQERELLQKAKKHYPPGTVYVPAHVTVDKSLLADFSQQVAAE